MANRRRTPGRNRRSRFGSARGGTVTPTPPPSGNNVQDNLNSGGAGVNQDITDDLGGGGNITDP